MRAKQAATGFFGTILFAVFTCGPTLAAGNAAARLLESRRSAVTHGHGIVQAIAEMPAAPAVVLDFEHSEADVRVEPDPMEEPTASEAPQPAPRSPPSTAKAPAATTSAPKTSSPATSVTAPAVPPDVELKRGLAIEMQDLPICRRPGGPEGPGIAEVTFMGDGRARVGLSEPYANTPVGACVARRLAGAAIPFTGDPITMRVRFEL